MFGMKRKQAEKKEVVSVEQKEIKQTRPKDCEKDRLSKTVLSYSVASASSMTRIILDKIDTGEIKPFVKKNAVVRHSSLDYLKESLEEHAEVVASDSVPIPQFEDTSTEDGDVEVNIL